MHVNLRPERHFLVVKSLLFQRVQASADVRAALDSGSCCVRRCVYKVVLGFKILGLKLVLQKENANHTEGAKVVAIYSRMKNQMNMLSTLVATVSVLSA